MALKHLLPNNSCRLTQRKAKKKAPEVLSECRKNYSISFDTLARYTKRAYLRIMRFTFAMNQNDTLAIMNAPVA